MKSILFLFIYHLFHVCFCQQNDRQWCWTEPVKISQQTNINPQNGGPNWGYCLPKGEEHNEKVPYRIYVETSNVQGSAASGIFYITLYGEEGMTQKAIITQTGFAQGTTTIAKIMAQNVGDINKIRFENGGADPYKCTSIRVELGVKFWDFDCSEWISSKGKKSYEDINLEGNQRYDVLVKTSNSIDAECTTPIYIQFIGTEGKSPRKMLSENGFRKGSQVSIQIQTKDVGYVYGIILSQLVGDSWKPDMIKVKRGGREETTYDPKGQKLQSPQRTSIQIMNPKPNSKATSSPSSGSGSGGGGSEIGGGSGSGEDTSKSSDGSSDANEGATFDDYNGGGLSQIERNNMIILTCDDIVRNNERFGPKYTKFINFEMIIAVCPPGCAKSETNVFGLGIHPDESGICKSAIVDRAMPETGGVIGIGVTTGLDAYDKAPKQLGIEVKSFKRSEKSFFTYKIDNIDMAEKDIRIVNHEGQPAFVGRVEVRQNGRWGSISAKGVSSSAARMICRNLKYQDGSVKNPMQGDFDDGAFCESFNGEDYCGPQSTPIHFMNLRCEGGETEIMQCHRDIAKDCDHKQDLIIECSNVNYDLQQDPDVGTVRLVEPDGSPAMKGKGRLEFFKGRWGTICNNKFNDKSARVACRQMGYDNGNLIGRENENGVCLSYNGQNFCGKSNMIIQRSEVVCSGTETKLKDCSNVIQNSCNHEQDVIIECEGSGDPSGKSQKSNKQNISPPQLGKLPLVPIIKADCQTTGKEQVFRGDPGSVFIVQCPQGCSNEKGTIWGTGIYQSDSSICRAAIHSGVNQDFGGLIQFIKTFKQQQYQSTTNRGITSTKYDAWDSSFLISKPNSLHIKLSISFQGRPQNSANFIFFQLGQTTSYVLPTLHKKQSQWYLQNHTADQLSLLQLPQERKKYHHPPYYSFLQIDGGSENSLPIPVFKWMPEVPGFRFNGEDTFVKTQGQPGADKTNQAGQMTIILRARMQSSKRSQQTLVSHSGCGGYALIINALDEVVFVQRCQPTEFKTGYYMPLDTFVVLTIVYDGSYVEFFVDGMSFNKANKVFSFKCDKNIDIGAFTETKTEVFNGEISYVQYFTKPLNVDQINKIMSIGGVADPKGHKVGIRYTTDQRQCLGQCTNNPIPGTPGAPSAPGKAKLGQADYGPGSDVSEGIDDSETPKDQSPVQGGTSQELKCDTLGTDPKFNGPTGKSFRIKCPRQCLKNPSGNVLGTMIYTDDSSICKAAIHSGFLLNEKGGEVLMQVANGEDFYQSSFQNNIQSAAHGPNARSMIFKEAPPIIKIKCNDTAAIPTFQGSPGTKFAVQCPKDCSKKDHQVYGDALYTDDSNICQAAIHSGLMTDRGGQIMFSIEQGRKAYVGKKRNGINSEKRGDYIRSFRVIGDKSNTCKYFTEKYNPSSVFANWQVIDAKGQRDGPSEWQFNMHPTAYGLAIRQLSLIKGSDYNFGSLLINKNFDCNDGLYKANLYFENPGQAALIFRYYDPNNFYAVELNHPGEQAIRLIKKNEGIGEVLKGVQASIIPKVWYRFSIVMQDTNLQLWMQTGNLRNVELLLNVTDEDLQRGSVGIATNANKGVYFDGLKVREYNPLEGIVEQNLDQTRIWDQCLVGSSISHRKKFCKSVYGTYLDGVNRCSQLLNFCEICCDNLIPKIENILNYACWKGCVKEAKVQEKKKNEQKALEIEQMAILNNIWRPKINEKIDYRPDALGTNSYFVPGVVNSIDSKYKNEDNPQEMKLTIKFFVDGKPKTEDILYPNQKLTRCGKSLLARTDCAE